MEYDTNNQIYVQKLYLNSVIIIAKSGTATHPVNSKSKPPISQDKISWFYYSSYQCNIALDRKGCLPKWSSSCNSSSETQEILLVWVLHKVLVLEWFLP